MYTWNELTRVSPLAPYFREGDLAIRQPWHMPARRLLDYLLVYVQEGECMFQVEGEDVPLTGGDFCLIQPNQLHSMRGMTSTITPFLHFDIFYNPNREESYPTKAGQVVLDNLKSLMQPRLNDIQGVHVPVKFKPSQPVAFRDHLLKVVTRWHKAGPAEQLETQEAAMAMIVMLIKDHSSFDTHGAAASETINWITSYISFRLSEPITVSDMAKRAHLSTSRFRAVFKAQMGMPPHRYLLKQRIQHAVELLRTSELPLEVIADYCGFSDVHHFTKAFKRDQGVPPGQFRSSLHE